MKITHRAYYTSQKRPEIAIVDLMSGKRAAVVFECKHCKHRVGRIMKLDDVFEYLRVVFMLRRNR